MVVNARLAKRANERRMHIFIPVAWGAAGLMCVHTCHWRLFLYFPHLSPQ